MSDSSTVTPIYNQFLQDKLHFGQPSGFAPIWMPNCLFDFQSYLVDWEIRQGRSALFTDCGTGKSLMGLTWAENVVRKTNKNVLLATPIGVGMQMSREAEKFGIEAHISRDGKVKKGITITNYERLHYFNPEDFVGMVADESSILKNFNGKTKATVTEFMRKRPYRLLCTATAAPNDYTELGTSSEALGHLGYTDMLNRFFKNAENNSGTGRVYGKAREWRFKGHSEVPFWQWLASWARAMRKPSDYGFPDDGFVLPPLIEKTHIVQAKSIKPGLLFDMEARDMKEEREEQRRTIQERCEKAAELAATEKPCVVWCNLNDEGDLLEKMLPDFIQVKGKTSEADLQRREDVFDAFGRGYIRGLIIKPKIGAWGLNWQHCAHSIHFPTYSYEQHYQSVRRFWRFGQQSPVKVDLIATESIAHINDALKRKAEQAIKMFDALVYYMNEAMAITSTPFTQKEQVPQWL